MNKKLDTFRQNLIYQRQSRLWRNFGFIPDRNLSVRKNLLTIEHHRNKDDIPYVRNKAYHNLCTGAIQPPDGAQDVLGLGLNYCIETPLAKQGQDESTTLSRLHRDTRLLYRYGKINRDHDPEDDKDAYEPSLYVPASTYVPREHNKSIEAKFFKFADGYRRLLSELSPKKRYNLTSHNRYCIRELKERTDLIKGFTDKNLGPFIMTRENYIVEFLQEHLLAGNYYRQLQTDEKNAALISQKEDLISLYEKHQHYLPSHHQQYFERSFDLFENNGHRIPQIYGCPKIHKGKKKKRPVVSCCGTFPQIFSKYCDFWMKEIVQTLLPSYIKKRR